MKLTAKVATAPRTVLDEGSSPVASTDPPRALSPPPPELSWEQAEELTRGAEEGARRHALVRAARLRAWRTRLPFEFQLTVRQRRVSLALRCLACGAALEESCAATFYRGGASWERHVLQRRLTERGCAHLAPLVGPEPEELRALIELELLAG